MMLYRTGSVSCKDLKTYDDPTFTKEKLAKRRVLSFRYLTGVPVQQVRRRAGLVAVD
jgi:hypothetical protein